MSFFQNLFQAKKEHVVEAVEALAGGEDGDIVLIPTSPDEMTDKEKEVVLEGNMVEDVPGKVEIFMAEGNESDENEREVDKTTFF
jgi:hypothetical protein